VFFGGEEAPCKAKKGTFEGFVFERQYALDLSQGLPPTAVLFFFVGGFLDGGNRW